MRKPTLSPSKLTTYLACPLKYRWTYIDPRGKWHLRAKSYYSFGTTLHHVLERFHNASDCGVETVSEAIAAFEDSWLDAGFSSAEEMAEAYGEGKVIIERYAEEHSKPKPGVNTLAVERLFRWDMGDFILSGRVDRLDQHDDGTLEIIDYKTQRELVCEDDVRCDIAMACYQLLLKKHYPDRPIRATLYALRSNSSASHTIAAEDLDDFEFDLKELGRKILCHEWYELTPVAKGLCTNCDFLVLCRKHPEYEGP